MPLFPGAAQCTAWNKKALRMKPEARRSVSEAALKNNRSDFLVERLRSFTRESHSCVIFVILLQRHNVPVNGGAGLGSFFSFSYCESIFTVDSLLVKNKCDEVFFYIHDLLLSRISSEGRQLWEFSGMKTHGGCLNRRSDSPVAVMSHEQTCKQISFLNH